MRIEPIENLVEFGWREDAGNHRQPGKIGKGADWLVVEWVCHAHREPRIAGGQRDGLVATNEVRIDDLGQNRFRRRLSRRSEEHTSELQSHHDLVCRLLLEKKKILTRPKDKWRNHSTQHYDHR